jgi:hypothetical protein
MPPFRRAFSIKSAEFITNSPLVLKDHWLRGTLMFGWESLTKHSSFSLRILATP